MNKRIRELTEQTGFTQQDLAHGRDQMLAEFAELIVRECAGVELYWLSEQDRKAVAGKIKKHFGVRE